LISGGLPAGLHETEWNGLDDDGIQAPSGVYILRLDADGRCAARKVVLGR
jgi:hypothetical protein